MVKCVTHSGRLWLKIVIIITIFCTAIIWLVSNLPAAENTQPNPTNPESGLKTPSPDIFFPESTHTFGNVFIGEKTEHVFKLVNRGDAVLVINDLVVGCDCTVAKLENWQIAPGGEEGVKITFSPDENTRRGRTAKFIYVNSNDPDRPKFKLRFTANVRRDVVYTPHGFELGFVPKGNAGTKRIVFKSKLNPADFNITKVASFHPSVAVSHGKLNDQGEWYVEASIKENAVPGKLMGNIVVFTNSVKQPEIKIQTYSEVVREVAAVPDRVCFGKIVKGKEAVRVLTVLHANGIKIEKVEPSLSWIRANIIPSNNTDDTSIEVELKLSSTDAPKGKSEGALSIYTNSKKFPVLKVHLCANVLEPKV